MIREKSTKPEEVKPPLSPPSPPSRGCDFPSIKIMRILGVQGVQFQIQSGSASMTWTASTPAVRAFAKQLLNAADCADEMQAEENGG